MSAIQEFFKEKQKGFLPKKVIFPRSDTLSPEQFNTLGSFYKNIQGQPFFTAENIILPFLPINFDPMNVRYSYFYDEILASKALFEYYRVNLGVNKIAGINGVDLIEAITPRTLTNLHLLKQNFSPLSEFSSPLAFFERAPKAWSKDICFPFFITELLKVLDATSPLVTEHVLNNILEGVPYESLNQKAKEEVLNKKILPYFLETVQHEAWRTIDKIYVNDSKFFDKSDTFAKEVIGAIHEANPNIRVILSLSDYDQRNRDNKKGVENFLSALKIYHPNLENIDIYTRPDTVGSIIKEFGFTDTTSPFNFYINWLNVIEGDKTILGAELFSDYPNTLKHSHYIMAPQPRFDSGNVLNFIDYYETYYKN